MAKDQVVVKADKIKNWHKLGRILKLSLLLLLLLLLTIYIVLRVKFHEGSFVVNLKSNESLESGLAIYESLNDRTGKRVLKAENIQFMDNITYAWLPENIDTEGEGSHNGDNYIAYTFYIENQGDLVFNYWYSITIDDVIQNVDEAARIIIYLNGEQTIYAKGNIIDREPEKGTTKFRDDEDGTIILQERQYLNPGDVDRMTVVVYLEGNDPECINDLLGGELRMHMDITEEHITT